MKKLLTALLVVAMILSFASVSFAANFSDTADLSKDAKESITKLNALDIINGYHDGTFKPANNITRAEFAKMACVAGGMGTSAEMLQGSASRYSDVAAGQWYTGYINLSNSQGWVKGYPDGSFRPNNQITYAEVITVLTRLLGYNDNLPGPWPVDYIAKAGALDITDGVSFDAKAPATRGDVAIMTGATLDCTVVSWNNDNEEFVEKVDKDGDEVSLLEDKMNFAKAEGIVTDIPRVTSSLKDDQLKIDGKSYYVVGDAVDFEAIFGVDVDAFLNKDDEVIFVDFDEDTVLFDALEDVVDDELTLVDADDDYDIDEDAVFYVDGVKLKSAEIKALNDETYDYAKVVINDDGDVIFVDAYNWSDYVVVEKVDGDEIFGYGDELDTEDFAIVNDGATIAVEEVVAGDIVFYNSKAEYAEVFNATVEGEIEEIFQDEFEVAGKSFDYTNDSYGTKDVQYIDEDGDIANFDEDVAEQMEEEGAVTVFLDRAGNAVFVAGDLGAVEKSTFGAVLYETAVVYNDNRTRPYIELKVVNEAGKAVTYDFALNDLEAIEVDGDEEWNDDAADLTLIGTAPSFTGITGIITSLPDMGEVVEITLDADGDVVELGFFVADVVAFVDGDDCESGDSDIAKKRMSSSVPVFIVESGTAWDDEDVEVTTYGELEEDIDLKDGDVVHDGSKALYLVVRDSSMVGTTDTLAVLTQVRKDSDGDITRIKALVDGKEVTYTAEDPIDPESWKNGDAVELEVIDANGKVKTITAATGPSFNVTNDFKVVTRDREIFEDNNNSWKLVEDGYIYDIADTGDIETMTFSELRDLKNTTVVQVVYDGDTEKYAKYILVGAEPGDNGDGDSASGDYTVVAVNLTDGLLTLKNADNAIEVFNLPAKGATVLEKADDSVTTLALYTDAALVGDSIKIVKTTGTDNVTYIEVIAAN